MKEQKRYILDCGAFKLQKVKSGVSSPTHGKKHR